LAETPRKTQQKSFSKGLDLAVHAGRGVPSYANWSIIGATMFFLTVQKEMGRIDAHNSFFQNFLAPVHNGKQSRYFVFVHSFRHLFAVVGFIQNWIAAQERQFQSKTKSLVSFWTA
jgi:hypothetical protein